MWSLAVSPSGRRHPPTGGWTRFAHSLRFRHAVLLGVSVLAAACGSSDDSPGSGPSTSTVDKVTVSPLEAAVERGNTVTLTAQPVDASGRPVSGTGVQWSTSDAAVANIAQTGVVNGVAWGVARLTAAAGNRSGSALVSVGTSVSQTVPASGGTVTTPGGEVRLVIPSGSVPDGTRITITPVTTSTPAPGTSVPGTVYKIGVFGVVTGPRPTITVKYSVVGLPAGFDETKLTLSRKIGAFWVPLPSTVNTTEKTITAILPAGSSIITDAGRVASAALLDEEQTVGSTLLGFEVDPASVQLAVGERRTVVGRIRSLATGAVVTPTSPNASSSATNVATVSSATLTGTEIRTEITAAAAGTAVITLTGAATGSSGASENFGGTISVTVAPQAGLTVNVSGLPSGVNAAVTVTGPNGFSRTLTGTQTISGLAAGTYTVAAQNVTASGQTYAPSPASQQVTIAAGESKTVDVAYAGTLGGLTVNVSGLPTGTNASITVTGPNGFSANVTQTQTLTSLAVGSYTVVAANVTVAGQSYVASPPTQTVTVSAGQTATAPVVYGIGLSGLTVTVNGLPPNVSASVTVTGPGGFTRTVANTQTLTGLTPGSYTVQADEVSGAGNVYAPTPITQSVTVSTGQTSAATVTYAIASGSISVTVSGLPSGTNAAIVVTGPSGFSRNLTGSQTLSSLVPGSYTVTASNVTVGTQVYVPTPATRTVSVTVGQTALAPVAYALGVGSLTVTISGLPPGVAAAVTVTGPGSFNAAVTSTTTLTGLTPGSYTVAAAQVTSGQLYGPTPPSQTVNVAIGQTATATVTYAAVVGNLTITVAGLPGGVAAAIVVTGPGSFSQNVTATQTLTGLTPGAYTVAASNVTNSGQTYAPNVASQNANVTAGQTATVTVTYAVLPAPPSIEQSAVDACPAAVPIGGGSTIRIFARNQLGGAIPGAQVSLAVSGTGNTFTSALITDASGFASTPFSSSVAQGKNITAQITNAGITINETASVGVFGPTTATQLVKVSGDNQAIKVGTGGAPFVVEAQNASGTHLIDIPIAWTVNGTCFFNLTGVNGIASASLTAPFATTPGGPFQVSAALPGGASVTFTYTYVP